MSDPFDLNQYAVGDAPAPVGTGDHGFDAPSDGSSALAVGSPPVLWLAAAIAAAILGVATASLLDRTGPLTLLPWVLAGPGAIVLLGIYSIADTRRRAMAVYSSAVWVKPLYVAAVVLILLAVVVTALNIALWVGRL